MSHSSENGSDRVINILPLSYGHALIKELAPVPTHIFKSDNHYLEKFDVVNDDKLNVFKTDYEFRKKILSIINEKEVALITDEKPIIYGGVRCTDDLTLVIGPLAITDIDQSFCKLYSLKHNATDVIPYRISAKQIASILLLIYSALSNKYIPLNDFLEQSFLSNELVEETKKRIMQIVDRQSLTNRPHNPGSFETAIVNAIKRGDVEELKRALNSIYANMRGTVAHNDLRNAKNLAIVDITIATRAAIAAGLSVENVYIISDAFILEVEDCKYATDANALARACALRCTQLVAKHLQDLEKGSVSSAIVSRACDYIDRHIYEKFDVQEIASKLKVSASYLSKLFKEEKKISLGQFTRMRKIETSKILLSNTDKSISEIALSLSFNSQSHFGRVFLEITGYTPAQFRNLNQNL